MDRAAVALGRETLSPNQSAKRDAIVIAAVRVLLREGVAGCTVRAIAGEAGVSKGAVHYYFADVDEIVDRAMVLAVRGWIDWLTADSGAPPTGASRTRKAAVAEAWRVMRAGLAPFAQGDRTLLPLWFEYWTVRTRAGRVDAPRELLHLLTELVASLLDGAGVPGAADRAIGVTAYLFGIGVHQILEPAPAGLVELQLAALSGLPAPP